MRKRIGPVQLAALTGVAPSTAHRVLRHCRISRLSYLDRGEPVRCYEHFHPDSMIHVDVRKLGNIPDARRYRANRVRLARGVTDSGHMKYVLLICGDETHPMSFEEIEADPGHQEHIRLRGEALFGARLRPTSEATTVRVRDGETLISDGPFAETKDFVGGITAIECDNLDEAIAIAAAHPAARLGAVEIRPVWEP